MTQTDNRNTSFDGPFQDIETITLVQLLPEARGLLIQHNCTMRDLGMEKTQIIFPAGTRRQMIWPRTVSERYRILLPDGQELRHVVDRFQEADQLLLVMNTPLEKVES